VRSVRALGVDCTLDPFRLDRAFVHGEHMVI
jgi:hypothetical protein